ncbi:dTDP-4-dehydrorhamnose reductase [Ruminococcaceae bacterium OttesenSCG-928-I18]|nr:dTDP-4-dehydrorhamnose reductase [Ruminococcaceae bacterium OttesenSCG-928-I18]
MRILITGANGQLGTELVRQLESGKSALGDIPKVLQGAVVAAVDIEDGDLTKLRVVQGLLAEHTPDVVINCAAFTNVDKCETERDTAFAANALAPRNLAIACEAAGAKLIHISTDYVFNGQGEIPFSEADLPAPRSVYGATKRLGEEYVRAFCSRWFIVRTAWLYGRQGGNFVKTILRVAKEKGELQVVNDQRGNPTNAEDLAHHLLLLAPTEEYGIYHGTGNGICSWYDFASEIVRLSGIKAQVKPCSTDEFYQQAKRQAERPAYSALDHSMLRATVGDHMRPWREALAPYIEEMIQQP